MTANVLPKFCKLYVVFPKLEYLKTCVASRPNLENQLVNVCNFMARSVKNFGFKLIRREFCTPPIRGVRNSVPLPLEVSGILYPSLWKCQEFYAPP